VGQFLISAFSGQCTWKLIVLTCLLYFTILRVMREFEKFLLTSFFTIIFLGLWF